MGKTSIQWTDRNWPFARDCRRKSPGWARAAVGYCRAAGIACFVKQMRRWITGPPDVPPKHWKDSTGFRIERFLLPDGSRFVPGSIGDHTHDGARGAIAFSLADPKGGSPEQWAPDLRVREFPS